MDIYAPKPFKEWKYRYCNSWAKSGIIDSILMSETGNTGDNMFHAFIPLFKGKTSLVKTTKELNEEAQRIYDLLLKDITKNPKQYIC